MDILPTFHDLGGVGLICPDSVPTVFGLLDPSIAPPLLYYSYIPIIVIALLFSAYVLFASRSSLVSRLFLWISITYSLILMEEMFNWIATPAALIYLGWQIEGLFLGLLPFLLVYFTYVFIREENMPVKWQWALLVPLVPILVLTPTHLNLVSFDLVNCEAIQGPLRSYVYLVQAAGVVAAFLLCIQKVRQTEDKSERRKAWTLGIGIIIFFGIYILSNVFGDATLLYEINLFGPIGMAAFLATITFLIVRYHAFNMRVFGAQALIGALTALIFAALFVRKIEHARYVIGGTLFFVIILGLQLIKSVRREVEQREHIEVLAKELAETNDRQETLIHFIGHEVKGFLTKDSGAFAALSEGDLGALPDNMKPFVEHALEESRQGADSVTNILKASNLKKGTVTYTKAPFDLAALVTDTVQKAKGTAEHKNLALSISIDPAGAPYTLNGDKENIGMHVLRNLIENSINYTLSGSVNVSLRKEAGKIIFAVKDTGVGITEEDKARLFTEGGHGKDSQKVNVHSTGYGLFIAKKIVDAHDGTIRAESEGQGKGSTFIVELPA